DGERETDARYMNVNVPLKSSLRLPVWKGCILALRTRTKPACVDVTPTGLRAVSDNIGSPSAAEFCSIVPGNIRGVDGRTQRQNAEPSSRSAGGPRAAAPSELVDEALGGS